MKKLIYLFLTVLIVACSSDDSSDNANDTTPPVISLIGSANVTVYQGDNFIDEGATATDNVDGDLTSSIAVSGNVDNAIIGNYILTYTVSDTAGNSASATRNVSIVEPLECLNGEIVYLDANGITVKACLNAQIGDTGNINGFTYTVVSEQQLRDYVNSNYPDLNRLVTSQVTDMSYMFSNTTVFNQPIGNWDLSNVNMNGMFSGAASFNQPIGNWETTFTFVARMFQNATSFNQDISNWDVSNNITLSQMFSGATSFNQDISNWDVSNVTDMSSMFNDAYAFNQPIYSWDVSNVTNMASMFNSATAFNQDLQIWDIYSVYYCLNFCLGATSWVLDKPSNLSSCTGDGGTSVGCP